MALIDCHWERWDVRMHHVEGRLETLLVEASEDYRSMHVAAGAESSEKCPPGSVLGGRGPSLPMECRLIGD